jgi:SAM-dependent methyltransferase
MMVEPLPWDFDEIVLARARSSADLLDLGTGGGEWLSSLPERPGRVIATESWEPNVAVAHERLARLGVEVVQVDPAPDNVDQDGEATARLPFPAESFHLVVARHEAFVAGELARILAPSGLFVTEQAGAGNDDDFHRLLEQDVPRRSKAWTLTLATEQVEAAGLEVANSGQAAQTVSFADVGAFVWYLKAIPWAVPEFSTKHSRDRLAELHEQVPLRVRQQRFWLEALKP